MRVLVLGGTKFVGRHITEAAIGRGHDVIIANRGISGASLFPSCRHVTLDRYGDAGMLSDLDFDVVIDTSGYAPDSIAASSAAVASKVRKYIFMSSIGAYDLSVPDVGEDSPTMRLEEGAVTSEFVPELYGAHKVRCEEILRATLGAECTLAVRAGLMIGPYDHTGRFTYWPVRIARGGDVLVPVGREMPVQIIDVRDVAAWIVEAMERGLHGTFNVVGTPGGVAFGDVLDACAEAAGIDSSDIRYVWATSQFLEAHDVGPWVEMPLWLSDAAEYAGMCNARNERARATGLRLRPLVETVRDILAEYRSRPAGEPLGAGLSAEREIALLAAWRAEIPSPLQ